MSVIKILPESLSNKIAAGEVVERPASVVKELVENAIDAGGTRITVAVERGGLSLIRVADNGTGMARDDALLSLERHATSKIVDEKSLIAIRTLGFRGEALPSIASVSRFSLITRDALSEAGTEITVSGGKIQDVRDAGAPVGTLIEVRQLFFNLPARRKFLKSAETEMGHVADMMTAFALGRHDIHFQLQQDGKTVRNWPAAALPRDRVTEALGRDTRNNLYAIDFNADEIAISGWISAPHVTRRTSQKIYLFVNGRAVKDRGLQYALFEGYRGRLVKGTYPVAVVFLTVPFDRVDVNVHPTKSEVRFSDRRIYQHLKSAVERVWAAEPAPPWERGFFIPPAGRETAPPVVTEEISAYGADQTVLPGIRPLPTRPTTFPAHGHKPAAGEAEGPPASPAPEKNGRPPFAFAALTVVGQFHNSYIVCETDRDIILIDQHAAHERVVFETLKQRVAGRKPVSQGLLVPETVDLSHREAAALESLLDLLAQAGLLLERFGQNTFIIKAVPELIADADAVSLVQELAGKAAEQGLTPDMGARQDEFLATMACHSAVRANHRLNEPEIRALLARMDACANPWHCPHGRPTTIQWSLGDIERRFKRIV